MKERCNNIQKIIINELTEKGVNDMEISKSLKINVWVVAKVTTRFWKEKMKNKNEQESRLS